MPSVTVSNEARTARLRAQLSLQLLHDSRTTANVKMLLEWASESVGNPIIIIIIIRKGRQCKAGRERLTPYQSEDPNPTTPTHRMKKEKGKTVGDKK